MAAIFFGCVVVGVVGCCAWLLWLVVHHSKKTTASHEVRRRVAFVAKEVVDESGSGILTWAKLTTERDLSEVEKHIDN